MQSNFDNKIIKHMLNNGSEVDKLELLAKFDDIKHIIMDKFEEATGCKLYNKLNLIKDIETSVEADESKLMSASIEAINKNMIPEITFNAMFKSNLDFTLVFKDDDIVILYKNKKVEPKNFADVKTDLMTNKLNYLPVITELYVNNIMTSIEKLINKDISVKYHLTDFPIPYWNLFEIKCKKSNSNQFIQLDKCNHLESIINGKIYQPVNNSPAVQIIEQNDEADPELETILMQIEELEKKEAIDKNYDEANKSFTDKELKDHDSHYRMEIMSYLNDMEVIYFLEKCEHIDKVEITIQTNNDKEISGHIQMFLDSISNTHNKMIKYYMINKMFNFIMKIKDYLIKHKTFRDTVTNKINQLQDDLYVIQTAGLEFSKEITSTFDNCKKFLESIEKSLNPDYVPKWNNTNQQYILNQIANNGTNNNYNNHINQSNTDIYVVEESSCDEDE